MIYLSKTELKYATYDFPYKKGSKGYVDYKIKGELLYFLSEPVRFSKSLTFKDFFNHLLKNEKKLLNIFKVITRQCSLKDFEEEVNTFYKTNATSQDLKAVQLCFRNEMFNSKEIRRRIAFTGVEKGTNGNRENGNETAISLDFSSLSTYSNLPLKLNRRYVIEQFYDDNAPIEIIKTKEEFTLFEVIEAVLFTMMMYGNPASRKKVKKELDKRLKESEKQIEKGEVFTWEEVKKKLDKRLKKHKKKN